MTWVGAFKRWPALSVIGVLLGLLGVVDISDSPNTQSQEVSFVPQTAREATTWYCTAGIVNRDENVRSSLLVVNPEDQTAGMWVSYFPSSFRADTDSWRTYANAGRVERVNVPAFVSYELELPSALLSEGEEEVFVSALVELDTPGATVAQVLEVETPTAQTSSVAGTTAGGSGNTRTILPCAEDVSTQWHYASGTTTADARFILGLFNPFPEAAVVDVSFATDAGRRSPTKFTGLIVAARSSLYLDVGSEAPRWAQLSTTVQARAGKVASAKFQMYDGSQGLRGTSMGLGAPQAARQWLFPHGSEMPTAYLVYNPGDQEARVEVDFRLDFDSTAVVELLVPAGQQVSVRVNTGEQDAPQPFVLSEEVAPVDVVFDVAHWAVIRISPDMGPDAGVVAEQLRGGGEVVTPATEGAEITDREDALEGEGGDADSTVAGSTVAESTDILDQLGNQAQTVISAARPELGLTQASTQHTIFGAVFCLRDDCEEALSQSVPVAVANPSSATISRVLMNGQWYELAPRRRILLEMPSYVADMQTEEDTDIYTLQASTPVVVSSGYIKPLFRETPEVFNR